MDTMVLLTLLVISLFCLAVFRRATTRRVHAPATPIIEIGDATVARRALVDYADTFSNRPSMLFAVAVVTGRRRRRSDNLTSVPYGPHLRALRCKLTTDILHPARLSLLAPLQSEAVEALVADIAARGSSEMVVRDSVHAAVFALVVRLCFGDGVGERGVRALRRVLQEFVLAVGEVQVFARSRSRLAKLVHWRRLRRFLASRGRQAELFLPLIAAARRWTRSDDGVFRPYVDSLIDLRVPVGDSADDEASGDGEVEEHHSSHRALTDDEMVSLVWEFLGAGTESVVSCVEWTLAHLVLQPEIQSRLRQEVADGDVEHHNNGRGGSTPYLRAVMLESLRLHPPVPFIMRDVRAAQALEDLSLPAGGARVHFILGHIGRDGKVWKNPDVFRPERFMAGGEAEGVGPLPGPKEVRMMPFGAGRRFCPAMGLGMVHVGCFLAALVREFEWTPAPASGGVDLTELDGFFKTMRAPLRARATPWRAST